MTDTSPGVLARLTGDLFPRSRCRLTLPEGVAVFVLAAVLAFFRLGTSAFAGRIWAEDGKIFLRQALNSGPIRPLSFRYAGYLSVGPRTVVGALDPFPLSWQGVGLHIGFAVAVGSVALVAYSALRGQLPSRVARAAVAACVVAVPLGPEVMGSIANLQWFLMFGGLIALFWTPSRRLGWVVMAVMALFATTSSPFAGFVFAAALIRYLLQRRRATAGVAVTALVGFAVQSAAMVGSNQRTASTLKPGFHAEVFVEGYVRRVLGDGVFGIGRFDLPTRALPGVHSSLHAGLVVLVAIVVLVLATARRRGGPAQSATMLFVAALGLLSLATFAAPIVLSGVPTDNPFFGGRYFVTPALFAMTGFVALVARVVTAARAHVRTSGRAPADLIRSVLGGLAAVGLVAGLVFGLVSSFDMSAIYHRDTGPSWATSTRLLEDACKDRSPKHVVVTATLPAGGKWFVRVRCEKIVSR